MGAPDAASRLARGLIEEADLFGKPEDNGSIEMGTVGWDDGTDTHFDDSGPVSLVKVTLFRGVDPGEDESADPTIARGHQILSRVLGPINFMPRPKTQVLVARPAGFDGPGMWFILGLGGLGGTVGNPTTQYDGKSGSSTGAKARAKLDFGADVDLVIKARSVTLSDYSNTYLGISPDFGIKAGNAKGDGFQITPGNFIGYVTDQAADPKAVAQFGLTKEKGIILSEKMTSQVASLRLKEGNFVLAGKEFSCQTANGSLGVVASPVSGIQFGPGIGIPSTSWFIQS